MRFSASLERILWTVLAMSLLFACCIHAEIPEGSTNMQTTDTTSGNDTSIGYLISFHDNASGDHLRNVTDWLSIKNITISETVNETYIKFIVANMTESVAKELEGLKDGYEIESIEVDDLVWDSMEDKSEL